MFLLSLLTNLMLPCSIKLVLFFKKMTDPKLLHGSVHGKKTLSCCAFGTGFLPVTKPFFHRQANRSHCLTVPSVQIQLSWYGYGFNLHIGADNSALWNVIQMCSGCQPCEFQAENGL